MSEGELQPVFVVGAARSGTSLLFRVLALHHQATWLSNWIQRFPALPQLAALNTVSRRLPDRRGRVWFGSSGDNAYVYGNKRTVADRLFPQPTEAESVYLRAGTPDVWDAGVPVPADTAARLRQVFEQASRWDRRQVHIAKRIGNNRRIPLLAQVFPQARFIEIVRDGRGVAASLANVDWWAESIVWWYGGNPASWREEGRDEWAMCARNWVEEVRVIRRGLEDVPAEKRLSITYEDLVAKPQEVVAKVTEFASLDPTDADFQAALGQVRFPNRNDRWRWEMSEEVLLKVQQIQREDLLHYGYELIDAPQA
jgi:omega-hydroxy-beta-dihydromenaquinone-9 sulfotransferase